MSLSVLFKTRFFASIKGEELNLCEWGAVVLLNNLDRSLPQAVSVDCRIPIPYHWVIFLSKKKPPVGPPSGNVANQTAVSAPSSTDLGAVEPPISVRTHPGSTAFISMLTAPSLLSSFANIIVKTFKLAFDRL